MADDTAPRPRGGDIHRLLDEAFADVEMTPDAQDLKEEVRANLQARVADLESAGVDTADAERRAVAELGDVRELVGESVAVSGRWPAGPAGPAGASGMQAAHLANRVRPKPRFVMRIVLYSVVAVAAFSVAGLGAVGVIPLVLGPIIALLGFGSTAIAFIVGDSLSQETTANHPMPQNRAGGYALATFLIIYGLGYAALVALAVMPVWCIVFAAVGVVAGVVLFSFLGATQTNRHKAWLRTAQRSHFIEANRFEEEPETAARFGIYTVVIWIVAFATFLVLSFTVGWAWSWLALLGGFVVMMLTLARMLFPPRKR